MCACVCADISTICIHSFLQSFGSKNKKMVGIYVQKGRYHILLKNICCRKVPVNKANPLTQHYLASPISQFEIVISPNIFKIFIDICSGNRLDQCIWNIILFIKQLLDLKPIIRNYDMLDHNM